MIRLALVGIWLAVMIGVFGGLYIWTATPKRKAKKKKRGLPPEPVEDTTGQAHPKPMPVGYGRKPSGDPWIARRLAPNQTRADRSPKLPVGHVPRQMTQRHRHRRE
jgi:cell division protein FtsN